MRQFLTDLLPATVLGLCIAMPLGPICLMCVQRTLALGVWFGIASGVGASTAHGLFSCLAEASATVLAQTAVAAQAPLHIAGGIALIVMGLRTCLVPARSAHTTKSGNLLSAFMSTLLIAAANPMTILPYLAIVSAREPNALFMIDRALAATIGVMFGSASWYLLLALSANAMLQHLQKATLDRLNMIAGILLIGLGVALCTRVVR